MSDRIPVDKYDESWWDTPHLLKDIHCAACGNQFDQPLRVKWNKATQMWESRSACDNCGGKINEDELTTAQLRTRLEEDSSAGSWEPNPEA